jgi:two-component sensor histidine kinase
VVAEDNALFQAMKRAAERLDERTAQNDQAREHQRLLLNELNHRVKNTLSTVQSIALQTARQTEAPTAFVDAFEGRLLSLSKTHSALINEDWEGAELREVLESELLHYGEGRFVLEGPSVMLPPRAALALGLVIHELATNASKYGALSTPSGRVTVAWSVDASQEPPRLRLDWTERGGPRTAPPVRRGFGSRLIERSLVGELSGSVDIHYAEEGLSLTAWAALQPGRPRAEYPTPA